ncbi:MAG: SURF1 family protein [Pseudomonadota bacterium]
MLSAIRQAGLLWPTLFSVAALAVLINLGNWQWQRKAWKEALIEQLAQSGKAEPKSLAEMNLDRETDELRFRRVRLSGAFADAGQSIEEVHVWTPDQGKTSWRVISPFRLKQPVSYKGERRNWVLVIRGRIAQADKSTARRPGGQVSGQQEIIGRLRFAETNWATPPPNIKTNEWYALDLTGMLQALQARRGTDLPPSDFESKALPFFVEAERALAPPPAPQPDLKSVYLSNRHLEYAVTWWGLALTLVGVYIAFARARLRGQSVKEAGQIPTV